jgi:hypothetical protein
MKKNLLFICFLFLYPYFCHAQNDNVNLNRVEAAKMAYITRQVGITPEEAQRFWPIYNNYSQEIRRARKDYQNDEVGYESRIVEIRKQYQEQFKSVLNNYGRVNKVFTSENNFRDLLRIEMARRQQMRRMNGGPMRQRGFK